jgi:hypothetical protein
VLMARDSMSPSTAANKRLWRNVRYIAEILL